MRGARFRKARRVSSPPKADRRPSRRSGADPWTPGVAAALRGGVAYQKPYVTPNISEFTVEVMLAP